MISDRERNHVKFLQRAAADHSERFKISAGIVLKNELISLGFNQMKTHPIMLRFQKNEFSVYLHAEIDAILKSLNHISEDDLRRSTLIVTRSRLIKGSTTVGISRPCSGCFKAIKHYGIKKTIWSTDIQDQYGVFLNE